MEDVDEDPEELLTATEIDDQTASCKESNEPENISTDVEDVGEEAAQSLNDDSLVTSTKTFKPLIRSKVIWQTKDSLSKQKAKSMFAMNVTLKVNIEVICTDIFNLFTDVSCMIVISVIIKPQDRIV